MLHRGIIVDRNLVNPSQAPTFGIICKLWNLFFKCLIQLGFVFFVTPWTHHIKLWAHCYFACWSRFHLFRSLTFTVTGRHTFKHTHKFMCVCTQRVHWSCTLYVHMYVCVFQRWKVNVSKYNFYLQAIKVVCTMSFVLVSFFLENSTRKLLKLLSST